MSLSNHTMPSPQHAEDVLLTVPAPEVPAETEETTPPAPISALVPSLSALALSFLTLHPVLLMATGGSQIHS